MSPLSLSHLHCHRRQNASNEMGWHRGWALVGSSRDALADRYAAYMPGPTGRSQERCLTQLVGPKMPWRTNHGILRPHRPHKTELGEVGEEGGPVSYHSHSEPTTQNDRTLGWPKRGVVYCFNSCREQSHKDTVRKHNC